VPEPEDLFTQSGSAITYEKVLEEKNKYIKEMFSSFVNVFCGVNVDFSFTDMFFNEIGLFNTLPQYKKKGLLFKDIILEDGTNF
jgi:hypothetical protein